MRLRTLTYRLGPEMLVPALIASTAIGTGVSLYGASRSRMAQEKATQQEQAAQATLLQGLKQPVMPTLTDQQSQEAQTRALASAVARRGRASTILTPTGGMGTTERLGGA